MFWSIRKSGLGSYTACPLSNEHPLAKSSYAIYRREAQISDEAAAVHAPEGLVDLLESMRAQISEAAAGDDPSIGIGEVESFSQNSHCVLAEQLYGVKYERVSASGRPVAPLFDLAIGLGAGELQCGVSSRVADRLAPALSRFLHQRYGTTPTLPAIENAAERAARLAGERQESRAREQQQRESENESAELERAERRENAVLLVAEVFQVDRERALRGLDAIVKYVSLS